MSSKFCPQTVLLIPDVHAKPGDDLTRLVALDKWLEKRRLPLTKIIQIGDLWDLGSLCTHDAAQPEWFERRLDEDLQSGFDALGMILALGMKHDLYASDIVLTLGNHEERYNKFMAGDNRLRTGPFPTTFKTLIRNFNKHISVYDFLSPYTFAGVTFQHYFTSGVMGRAQGGENIAVNLLRNQLTPVVCGHTHIYSYAERTAATGQKVQALCAGCFIDPTKPPSYARGSWHLWRNGVSLLHIHAPGQYDLEFVSCERLMAEV